MYPALLLVLSGVLPIFRQEPGEAPPPLTEKQLEAAGAVIGLEFTPEEIRLMLPDVIEDLRGFSRLRERSLDNAVFPALSFSPLIPGVAVRPDPVAEHKLPQTRRTRAVERPAALEELAYADLQTLGALILSRKVSCVELTEMYLGRLKRLDPELHCVITLTEKRALAQARRLDTELEEGRYRGPLHGIPWGAKDLIAAKGYRTTWGAKPFEDQVIDLDAAVVERLDAAGAILIAKLSLGALAWGDVWFGGMTRNPWKLEEGSSGSSAGPAAAVAAGCVGFAIGSETLGSIVSPSARCGCSSLRPTFGRVSRYGSMALSWSMDKLGPLCRSADDASLVFAAIQGADPRDPSTAAFPYAVPHEVPVRGWRVGFLAGAAAQDEDYRRVLDDLEAMNVELMPVELPDYPLGEMLVILSAEAAAAFDVITRDGRDDLMVRQIRKAWPNVFRAARLIPAVEYLQANRLRTRMMQDLALVMADVDLIVHPSFGNAVLTMANLTGHPTVVCPSGFQDDGTPRSVSFTGQLYGEASLLAMAGAWQRATGHHLRHPDL